MNDLEDDEMVLRVEKDPFIGKKLGGRYEIVSVLGRGGMGVVYKGNQVDIGRMVAIKTLHISKIVDSNTIQRFRSEAQAVSRVRHPNTVMLYDFGVSEEGVPYLVMDMIEGRSFRDVLKENAPLLNLGRVNNVFQQVCAALNSAHDSGIIHRDLKPENIMICQRQGQTDWVYVLDFGIAGMMEAPDKERQEIVGSPPYMSPEQCSMQRVIDHRTDIYSLGVCLFEALSGKFPFQARTAMEMIDGHMNQAPRLLKDMGSKFSTYESLSQMILKAMDKKPEKRQQSIDEFAADLEEAIKKDSRRGMQLKDRATMEVSAPKPDEFVELKSTGEEKPEDDAAYASIVKKVQAFVQGDESATKDKGKTAEEQPDAKYYFSNCPHCEAPTQPGLSLCLACGRSLASKSDYSKIRASKGEFSLPRYQEILDADPSLTPSSLPTFSQRSRLATAKAGNAWMRTLALVLVGIALLLFGFISAGGGTWLAESFHF